MYNHPHVPLAVNEPVLNYAPNSPEKKSIKAALADMRSRIEDIPMYIGAQEVRTGNVVKIFPPHDIKHQIGQYHKGDASHVKQAIDAALAAKYNWEMMSFENRAAIFLRAADLIAGPYRAILNGATMLGQSKNVYQAEIDSACEIIDFLRFNVQYMSEIYNEQPLSGKGMWNRLEYRPLEGFLYALTPFNFTAIAGNLPSSMAMLGNVVVWKPSNTQIYSANILMKIFKEAGLPDGVINLMYVDGPVAGDIIFNHPEFAGIHYTGSTGVFNGILKTIYNNIDKYKSYPRNVGETGGKDFIVFHKTAKLDESIAAIVRGAYEFQGQKCSAASRIYVPQSLWAQMKDKLVSLINSLKVGPVEDFTNFVNAVIDEKSFKKIAAYIDAAKSSPDAEILAGGTYDNSAGYFIRPTLILAKKPDYVTLCEEIFGPVLTVYVYADDAYEATLDLVDKTSPYALTGSIIAQDRYAVETAMVKLRNCAGNFYINDKPTGAVVGQQPFGGARGSGTNDKAGSKLNLLRWVSARTIKETFVPVADYRYDFLKEE